MKLSARIKPISYLKSHGPELIRGLAEGEAPVIITLHGEPKAVLQDVARHEETQETMALLKALAVTNKEVENGKLRLASEAFERIRDRVRV